MSYNAATDYVALWRTVAGGVSKAEMPGLDFVAAALGRSGLVNISVSGSQPVANQATTAWFQPATPSYSSEGSLFLWNATGAAYAAASTSLLMEMLAAAQKAATRSVAISSLLDTLATAQGSIVTRNATQWQAVAPGNVGALLLSGGAASQPNWLNAGANGTVLQSTGTTSNPAWVSLGSLGVSSLNGITGSLSIVAGTGIASVNVSAPNITINASAAHIPGTATNDNAAAGELGEFVSQPLASGSALALNSTPANILSISLTAGDWDVCSQTALNNISGTGTGSVSTGISTTSATLPAVGTMNFGGWTSGASAGSSLPNNVVTIFAGPARVSITTTTTVYLVGQLQTVGSMNASAYGTMRARRVR